MTKPVQALVGSDAFLQNQKLAGILRELGADAQRIDVDGERADPADVFDELRSFAMFGGAKAVVVRNADEFLKRYRESLENYCEKPSSSGTLVLRLNSLPKNQRIYKIIARNGVIEACEPPRLSELPRWITSHARSEHKLMVASDAAALLAELIGDDLGRLDSELAKLAISANGKLDVAALRGTVAFQREQEMYDLTNALASGHRTDALRRWRQLVQLDSSAEFRAITWLGIWLEEVGAVLAARKAGTMSELSAKMAWKYRGERWGQFLKTVDVLGEAGYARALNLLAEVDYQSKTGVGDAAENVERFILSVSA